MPARNSRQGSAAPAASLRSEVGPTLPEAIDELIEDVQRGRSPSVTPAPQRDEILLQLMQTVSRLAENVQQIQSRQASQAPSTTASRRHNTGVPSVQGNPAEPTMGAHAPHTLRDTGIPPPSYRGTTAATSASGITPAPSDTGASSCVTDTPHPRHAGSSRMKVKEPRTFA